jgi:hypothetical protein
VKVGAYTDGLPSTESCDCTPAGFGLADDALVNDDLRDHWRKPAIREWAALDIIGASLTTDVTTVIEHYKNFYGTSNNDDFVV